MKIIRLPSVLALSILLAACGGEKETTADGSPQSGRGACPVYDAGKKADYADPTKNEDIRLCIPQQTGVILYHEFSEPILVNLKNSRKMMQMKFAAVTKHDNFALAKIASHEMSMRSAFSDRLLQVDEAETGSAGFRTKLQTEFAVAANSIVEKYEAYGFNVVEEVLITDLVVQ